MPTRLPPVHPNQFADVLDTIKWTLGKVSPGTVLDIAVNPNSKISALLRAADHIRSLRAQHVKDLGVIEHLTAENQRLTQELARCSSSIPTAPQPTTSKDIPP